MALTDALRRARGLTPAEWAALVEGLALAVVVEASLRLEPLSRVIARSERALPAWAPWPRERAARLAALGDWPCRVLPFPSSCLRRSLVVTWLLRRRGLEAALRFGVRKGDGGLEAHAWVTSNGVAFGAPEGPPFAPLESPTPLSRSVRWSP